MPTQADLDTLADFRKRLSPDFASFELLSRDDQRALVLIAQRFADALDGDLPERARARSRELVELAQASQLRADLLERAGDGLVAFSINSEAVSAWEDAKRGSG